MVGFILAIVMTASTYGISRLWEWQTRYIIGLLLLSIIILPVIVTLAFGTFGFLIPIDNIGPQEFIDSPLIATFRYIRVNFTAYLWPVGLGLLIGGVGFITNWYRYNVRG